MDPGIRRIGFILFEGADLLDAVGPAGAFACADRQFARTAAPSGYAIDYFSPDGGAVSTLEVPGRRDPEAARPRSARI